MARRCLGLSLAIPVLNSIAAGDVFVAVAVPWVEMKRANNQRKVMEEIEKLRGPTLQ